MDFDETQFETYAECYAEWAETELIWGKGMFNWCRIYTKKEPKEIPFITPENIDIDNHPLCKFGG